MKEIIKKWRAIRKAANIIYKEVPNYSLRISENDFYDILVRNADNLEFGIKVFFSSSLYSKRFNDYIIRLKSIPPSNLSLPIVLMCVNEIEEKATFGFLVAWDFKTPTI